MPTDEDQIRSLVRQWHAASEAGDTEAVLALMTEDAVFLTIGRAPMSKSEFAAISSPPAGGPRPKIEATQDIVEVKVSGELAFMRSSLSVSVTPPGAAEPVERVGTTLTVFRKVGGRWLLARDANLLVPRAKT
jgi:uncharacterized protein (TIGR02246 family)